MVQRCLLIAAALSLAAACEKVKRPSFDDGEASEREKCGVRVDNLSRRVAKPGRRRHHIEIPRRMLSSVPISSKSRMLDGPGPELELAIIDGRIEFAHQHIADIDNALKQRLMAESQLYELNREFLPDPTRVPPIYIWTAANTPVATLVAVLAVMPALYEPRLLVYGARDTDVYAPPSDAPEQVREFWRGLFAEEDPRERASMIEDAVARAIGRCQPLVDLYGNIAAMDAVARLNPILNESPRAIRDCQCQRMDVELYEAVILAMVDAHRQRQRWIPLVFTKDASVQIALPHNAEIGDLVAGYDALSNVERTGKLRLHIEPPAPVPTAQGALPEPGG